ncbi:LuxR family two component transcriptional regulator [Palleronia aestuarii]|uniref:LuxR family two component transcriptional regulator n=1 Tax=Palleronia aestuarii TaxID=568105 RepID=A0A2W7MZ77_9RHOB|nr:response regulator transcription factor [Palleronia aestuarii]PZX13110.1 LuxR family two component transcriptional regulator [Palleronia aestuarii]
MFDAGRRSAAVRAIPKIFDVPGEEADHPDPNRLRAAKGGRTALIADDDEFFRMALGVILTQRLGFSEVIEATSLDDAVDLLSRHDEIALGVFDLDMPGMKSASSLRAVREEFADLKITVISGSRRRDDILMALTSGVHGYVPKSLGATQIFHALSMVLEGLIYVPQSITMIEVEEAREPAPVRPTLEGLTPRQKEVLELLVLGKSNKEIARRLDLGEGTVKVHMSALFRNLGTASRSATAALGGKLLGG